MKKSTHHAILTQVIMARRYNMESKKERNPFLKKNNVFCLFFPFLPDYCSSFRSLIK